ncbi:HAAS signaling domain-containing protein [Microbacterium sp. A93]|uniref:HAAS signaling domain-containing protein n=1 Tax=Microbacterium sp. A93 TaxID=3450716 RepID=UPI003F4265D8
MNIADADRLRGDYLKRLDAAMRNVPHGVAAEIRGGILEELQGLDAAATAARIAQLGDPEAVAREAQDEAPVLVAPVAVPTPVPPPAAAPTVRNAPATSTRGFAIAAALTLSVGGIVLPFAGWVVGVVLVCFSSLWRAWEKAVAIIVPFVALIAIGGAGLLAFQAAPGGAMGTSTGSGEFSAPVNNPLLPATYDLVWSGLVVVGILLIPASGLWLLWRLRRRPHAPRT